MSEKGPTSEDLNRTVDLLAGLGDERPETGEFIDSAVKSNQCHFQKHDHILQGGNEKLIISLQVLPKSQPFVLLTQHGL